MIHMRYIEYNAVRIGLWLFVWLLLLGSCSQEESVDLSASQPVLFNATKESVVVESDLATTRAGIDDSSPAIDSMDDLVATSRELLIYGTRYSNGGAPSWVAGQQLFMNGLTGSVVKNGSKYPIDYSPLKYYVPADNERYDFKLFFPAPEASGSSNPSGVAILSPTGNRPLGLRVDLHHRPDLMKATVTGASKSDQPVPLEFSHLLTSVILKIVKVDNTGASALEQNIYINKLAVSGVMRGTYDVVKEKFESPVKADSDPSLVDVAIKSSILAPGYTTDEKYLVPTPSEGSKEVLEMFLFPVAPTASTVQDDMERYFFDIWLNERCYSFMIPDRNDSGWDGWKAGERYTYTIKVSKADIYIELDKDHISREPWKTEDKEDITIGVDDN